MGSRWRASQKDYGPPRSGRCRRERINVGALGVLLPGPVEPKDAKSQRRKEPERTAAVPGGGQREQITVERCKFGAMARKEGTKVLLSVAQCAVMSQVGRGMV